MIRRLVFTDAEKLYFKLIFEAFRSRGSATQNSRVTKEDRRSEGKILRALKTLSNPVGPDPEAGEIDARSRTLQAGGGTLDLEQPEYKRLVGFLETAQWASGVADVVADLEDWMDTAEKIEPIRVVERGA